MANHAKNDMQEKLKIIQTKELQSLVKEIQLVYFELNQYSNLVLSFRSFINSIRNAYYMIVIFDSYCLLIFSVTRNQDIFDFRRYRKPCVLHNCICAFNSFIQFFPLHI